MDILADRGDNCTMPATWPCNVVCSYPIAAGARVTITHDPDTCVGARKWDGCAPSGNQCTVTMNGQITVTIDQQEI